MNQDDGVDFYKSNHSEDGQNSQGPAPSHRHSRDSRPERSPAARSLSWTAPEYMEFERNGSWYFGLAVVTAAISVGLYFLGRDYFAIGSVVAAAILLAVFVARKPRDINYRLSDNGLEVGNKRYGYGLFKSFTIVRQGQLNSVELLPLKRFMPPVSACFAPRYEEKVLGIVGEHLPYVEHRPGTIDKLSQRLRL